MINEMIQTAPLLLALIVMGAVLVPMVIYLILDSASLSRTRDSEGAAAGILDAIASVVIDSSDSDD